MGCRVAIIVLTMNSEATVGYSLESALAQEGMEPFFIVINWRAAMGLPTS